MYDAIVVGCGLSGAVAARYMAEEKKKKVLILERREHIGGNMYDYVNKDGILVHKYGPHTFHTNNKEIYDYICRFGNWNEYKLTCGAVIDGKYTPTPFNYTTIDTFFDKVKAKSIKESIDKFYSKKNFATVLEMLNHRDLNIKEYAKFLFDKDYSLYTAKQWGVSPEEIDPSVLSRVPVRFNYEIGYFDDKYQVMPEISYTEFFENILNYSGITIRTSIDARTMIRLEPETCQIYVNNQIFKGDIIYTGPIDELFENCYGNLPYRSLRFEWITENKKSFQPAPVVAYPQANDYTRITEYTKLPLQEVGNKTTYAIEYPLPYESSGKNEPYYPVLTAKSKVMYEKYRILAEKYKNLFLCGRLADFKYYNMDQVLENTFKMLRKIE